MQHLSHDKRIVVLYAKDVNNHAYQMQLKEFSANQAGLDERDIVIQKVMLGPNNIYQFKKNHIPDDFTFVLIGKDGGEKYRSIDFTPAKKLFAIIDAMPMRRDEMRRRN